MPLTASQPEHGLTLQQAEVMLNERGAIPDIGQVGPTLQKALNKAVREGRLTKYRGHWDSLCASYGIGPLKTIYATPAFAKLVEEADAGIRAIYARKAA